MTLASAQAAQGAAAFRSEIREGAATIGLFGEATGITVPRHVRTFVASIEGVAPILSAAFSAVAVFFLIEALIKGTQKMTEWIATTFIFTDAMQAVNNELLNSNKAIVELNTKTKELQEQFESIGLSGSVKFLQDGVIKQADADKAAARFRDISNEIYALRNGLVSVPEAIGVVNAAIRQLNPKLSDDELKKQKLLLPDDADKERVLNDLNNLFGQMKAITDKNTQELLNINQQAIVAQEKEDAAATQARIQAAQKGGDALTALRLQQTLLENSALKVSYLEDAVAKKQADDQKYQNEIQSLERQKTLNAQLQQNEINRLAAARELFDKDPAHNAQNIQAVDEEVLRIRAQFSAKAIELDGQIVAANRKHQADELAATVQFLDKRKELLLKNHAEIEKALNAAPGKDATFLIPIPKEISTQYDHMEQQLQKLLKAYRELGINGSAFYAVKLDDERRALQQVQEAQAKGLASDRDVIAAKTKVIETEVHLMREQGASEKEINKVIEAQKKEVQAAIAVAKAHHQDTTELDKYLKDLDKLGKGTVHLGPILKKFEEELTETGKKSMAAGAAMGEAVSLMMQAYAQGAESIKESVGKMVQAELEGIASIAEDKGTEQLARAFGDWPDFPAMAHHFASATLWFGLAGALSAGAHFAGGMGSSSNEGGGSSNSGTGGNLGSNAPDTAKQPEQQPVTVTNVQHFATGALLSQPVMAVVGDVPEAIIPSGQNSRILYDLADRIVERMQHSAHGVGDTYNHYWNIDGVISSDNLNKVVRQISQNVNRGKSRLLSSNSLRITKRS